MTYLLLLIFFADPNWSVQTVEFNGSAECEMAQQLIQTRLENTKSRAFCVPTGRKAGA